MDNIRLKNFRNIEDSGVIKLRPLTIFVGKNGMGKSSLMRLFPLIKQSVGVSKRGPFLWYSEKGVDFGDFSTVVMRGKKNIEIEFSINFAGSADSFDVNVNLRIVAENVEKNNDDISYDYVEFIKFEYLGNIISVEYQHNLESNYSRKANVNINGTDFDNVECDYFMSSMFPIVNSQKNVSTITGFKELINTLSENNKYKYRDPADFFYVSFESFLRMLSGKEYGYNVKNVYNNIVFANLTNLMFNITMSIQIQSDNIIYIGPFRDAPQRYYRLQNLSTHQIDMSGSNMAVFTNAMSKDTLKSFNQMAKSHFDFELKPERHSGHISLNIAKEGKSTNIVDNGFGYSQMMPVLLALHKFSNSRANSPYHFSDGSQIFCIEQPELHLHPNMQYKMGKTFVDSTIISKKKQPDNKIIVETHSRSFIDAVGDSVAKGEIEAKDVAVYIFDIVDGIFSIKLSEFDEEGYLNKWPIGFLD